MLSSKKILIFTAFFLSFFFSIQIHAEPLKTVRLGYFSEDTLFMSYKPNYKSGYGYEYLQEVADIAGWKYEYEYGNFTKLYNELLQGKIDILANVSKTPERAKILLFPDEPMGVETTSIYVRKNDERFTGFSEKSLNGKSIALDKTASSYGNFIRFITENKIKCKIIDYSEEATLSKAYENSEIDAVLDSDLFALNGWESVLKIDSSDFFIAANKNQNEILHELNKAQEILQNSSPFFKGKLHEKYYLSKVLDRNTNKLENDWLEKHYFQIKVGCLKQNIPFASYNKKTQKAEGALVEFLKTTVSRLGLNGTSLNFFFYDSQEEMENALENEEVDVIYPVSSDYYLAEDKNYMISGTIFTIPLSLIYNGDKTERNFQKIAFSQSAAIESYLKKYYPKIIPTFLNPNDDIFEAVSNKKFDGAVINSYLLETILKTDKRYKNYKSESIEIPLEVAAAVRRNSPGILSILRKGISLVNDNERRDMILQNQERKLKFSNWQTIKNNAGIISLQIIIVIALLFIAIYEFLMLRRYSGCDSLTLLISKKKLYSSILEEISKKENSNSQICLLIARLDNFKRIKKIYGRKCAKEVIIHLAKKATMSTERSGLIFRSGDAEVTVLSHRSAHELRKISSEGCEQLQRDGVVFKGKKVNLKVDVGIAEYKPGIMPLQLYKMADRNLFDVKNDIKPSPVQEQ